MNKITLALLATLGSTVVSSFFSPLVQAEDSLQTIETEHARIHFHKDYQAFAQQVASKFEPIYADVSARVGFEQNDKLDFLIGDDFHQANGYAIPLTAGKIVKVFSSSPRSEEALGAYNDWLDLVISHELTHKIHMSQPSRSWRSMLDSSVLDSDILNFSRYPRWVTEGYATVIETEYTQQGRVNSDYIKAMLQQWATEGQLPSYDALNGNSSYEGNRMAYYQGSAFLFWLQANYGQEKLQQLWKRSTAKKYRDFDDAFTGLFLDSPRTLYKKFVVEQTVSAKQTQLITDNTGSVWQNNSFKVISSEPSPQQDKLLQLEVDDKGYTTLSIFSFAENNKAKDKFIEDNEKLLEADKEDVANSTPEVFNREAEIVIKSAKKSQWRQARWLDDNHALVLQSQLQDNQELGFELVKVELTTGKVEKITQSLRLHDFTLTPDKKSVIATSHFAGFNQLIKISLGDGSYQSLDSKRLNQPMDNLTLSPDGETLALMAIHEKHWQIHFYQLATQKWQVVNLPLTGNYTSHLRWQTEGVYFSQSHNNITQEVSRGVKDNVAVDVYRLQPETKSWQQLTQGEKLATNAFTINDQLIYLSTTSQGQDTYSQDLNKSITEQKLPSGNYELLTLDKPVPEISLASDLSTKNYGIGPQTGIITLTTGYISNEDNGLDLVIRGGDPLGRLRWQAAVTHGDQQDHGAISIKSNWQNIEWFAEFIDSKYENDSLKRKNQLFNIDLAKTFIISDSSQLKVQLGVGTDDIEYFSDSLLTQADDEINHYRVQGQYAFQHNIGRINYGFSFNAALIDYESSKQEKHTWQRNDVGLGAFISIEDYALKYSYQDSEVDDDTPFYALLTQGGQLATTTSQVLTSHKVDPRVPLAWQTGFHFKQHNVEVDVNDFTLFYLQHEADENDTLAAYGVELKISMTGNMTPLLDGLTLLAGFSWYEEQNTFTDLIEDQSQFYLSGTYQFK
ncbi:MULTISPECIES: hypothetical protein [unclassified Colwellia]|uniref:hypothetical protein n=1 Tax=unclassified Colwellia TaxID=196834 RepID=UPI0015F3EFBB|nr:MULTISPECIES: hypothetical protein [unclassified Colwellia]MBA6233233.1 hypothetical protein [Colwellia sp. MB02u-7]MBA6236323.1 hypothetical protein [Colwellia sp. MB02u-11]MBA6256857.1 hypothetical protein [Colwellia sp. MB3u-28]MBA6261137.1 hypothetical protein [Colwellia sp. MB3u-41]MBA6298277.1 hypothetical protein [Colwellia sp. MB3u-22]